MIEKYINRILLIKYYQFQTILVYILFDQNFTEFKIQLQNRQIIRKIDNLQFDFIIRKLSLIYENKIIIEVTQNYVIFKQISKRMEDKNKIKSNLKDKSQLNNRPHQVNPVIIQLDESQQIQNKNESIIKKMIKNNNSSIKFAGGYKDNPQHTNSLPKKQLYRPEAEQPKFKSNITNQASIYQQVGVSKMQSKYRGDENTKNVSEMNAMEQLEDKIELLKKDRQMRNNSLLQPRDVYNLADNKDRIQSAIHVHSSLDVINLQNIEAKLQAHLRNLKPIQEQYNNKKGKQSSINRFGYMKVNLDVDKQYAELEVNNDKIYELARKRQNMQPEQIQIQEMWEMRKRNDPKLAEYDAKYKEYLVSKGAKNLMGSLVRNNLYEWDKYKQPGIEQKNKSIPKNPLRNYQVSPQKNKSLQKQLSLQKNETFNKNDIIENKQLTLSTSKYGPDGLESVKDIRDIIAKKDDKFIASYIFAQVDKGKVGFISKEQLHEYLISQDHIIKGYDIDTKWLYTDIDNFETKRKGMFSKAELAIFLVTLQKIDHPKLTLTNKSQFSMNNTGNLSRIGTVLNRSIGQNKKPIQSTFYKYKPIFEKLFNTLDFNDDKIIKRSEYIENIYIDSDCVKILDDNVIVIRPISKSIKVRQIIGFILDDYEKERNEKLKKSKEYITFSRFCQYFDISQSLDLSKIDKKSVKKKQQQSTEYQVFDLPIQYIQILKDIFNEIPRIYQDYIVSVDFVQAALRDPQILALSDQLCRIQSIQTRLPLQSLQTALHRMQKQCDQYSTWESIKLFFSRRGRPLDWDYELITQKRELREKKLKQQRQNVSKQKLRETQKYFQYSDQIKKETRQKIAKVPNKYTVPQPFDITDMKQKQNIKQVRDGQAEFEELKKKFKAAPVNKQILEPKPQLIDGKLSSKSKEKQFRLEYKYENYENDRIERALKRAQQQNQIEEKLRELKERAEIKATQIGVDLTKKYLDVIKQQKKKRQNSKFKPTQPKASDSLYPADPSGERAKKMDKVKQSIQKAEEIAKRKKQQIDKEKQNLRQKNEQVKKKAQQAKQRQKEQQKKRDEIANEGRDFKPKITSREISDKQRQQNERRRKQRQKQQKQNQLLRMKFQEQRRKKILQYDKKQVFISIDGLTNEQILDKIDSINFQDLLLDQKAKQQYRKQFNNKNKTRKQLKDRESGLAGRQRAAMQQQQRRIMEQKRKYKETVQKQKTKPKINDSKLSTKGDKAAYTNDLNFHKSKALRRYRAIMQGKKPESQFDKYSQFSKSQKPNKYLDEQMSKQALEQHQQEQNEQPIQ